jgi:diadenosine tetraphosphate (Ap4A) HIT family hydrolase
MSTEGCPICDMVNTCSTEELVLDHHLFRAQTLLDAPGWLLLSCKRHAEGFWSLTEEEAAAFGLTARQLTQALQAQTTAARVYVLVYNETTPHLHAVLIARRPDEAVEDTGLHQRAHALADRERALAMATELRAILG